MGVGVGGCVEHVMSLLQLTEGQDAMLDMLKRSEADHQRCVGCCKCACNLSHSHMYTCPSPTHCSSYTEKWRSLEVVWTPSKPPHGNTQLQQLLCPHPSRTM